MGYIKETKTTVLPNFLASEVGLITKTYNIASSGVVADDQGDKIVKGGTIYPTNDSGAEGIVFDDVDVSKGDHAGSLIVAGRIYKNRLHTPPEAEAITALNALGIIFVEAPETTR